MKSRREAMLEELGLLPAWRLRGAAAAPAPAAEGASPAASPAPAPTVAAALPLGTAADRRAAIAAMSWPELKGCVAACTACNLHATRKQTVLGVGDEIADWLFVGEGPGAEEDARGEPFVGQAGRLLDNMLAAIRLKRGDNVYIANVVKCRPPGNRNPEPDEVAACEPFLERQIALIRPRLIVALGRVAVQNLLKTDASIASLRRKVHDYHGTPLVVTYHPAYLLRNLPDKAKAWEDLCFAVDTLRSLQAAPAG
ncbi:MAG TPA: uracil-DNA glycosylase [Pelomicrobium sp.]|nr:uracil-DNA glycosylase [Pelomicrobium sp.]